MGKKTIHDYDLPSLHIDSMEDEKTNYWQIMEEKSIQVPHENYDAETKLNPKQKVAFTIIMEMINSEKSGVFSLMDQEVQVKYFFIERYLHKWDQDVW